jgi:hypothetical protein
MPKGGMELKFYEGEDDDKLRDIIMLDKGLND